MSLRVTQQTVEALGLVSIQSRSEVVDMGLTDSATEWHGPGGLHDLALDGVAAYNADYYRSVTSSLTLVETVGKIHPYYEAVLSALNMGDSNYGHASTVNQSLSDTLEFIQTVGRDIFVTVTHDLGMSDGGERKNRADTLLSMSDAALAAKGGVATSTFTLTQSVIPGLVPTRSITADLGLGQSVVYYVVSDRRYDRQYWPFLGAGLTSSPVPPTATLAGPMEGITAPFQLVYPATGEVTDSITLPAPNFGNKDRLSFQRINRETRGGTLVVFADATWPKIQTHVLSFSGLTRAEALDYLDFVKDHLGQEIGMIDWESRYWQGVLTTPVEPVVEDSFNSFTCNFSFEGTLVSWLPQILPVEPGTPRRRIKPVRGATPTPEEPVPPIEPDSDSYTAESDDTLVVGQPIYIKNSGHVALAKSDSSTTAKAVGFCITAANPGFAVSYITEGKLTLTDWTAISGTATLTPGATYFLGVGLITATVPTTGSVVKLGEATSTLTFDIEIEQPILL